MTQNQIAFYKAKEERRHNIRTEGQSDVSINENIRHNKATESINWYSAKTGAAVGFAQAAAAQAQAAAANKQAAVAATRAEYDYAIGLQKNENDLKKINFDNQINWAKHNENIRHNKKMEGYKGDELIVGSITSVISGAGQLASGYSKVYPLLP